MLALADSGSRQLDLAVLESKAKGRSDVLLFAIIQSLDLCDQFIDFLCRELVFFWGDSWDSCALLMLDLCCWLLIICITIVVNDANAKIQN